MPNAMAPITVQASLRVGRAILAEAGLSYVGFGTQPPIASWGKMRQGAPGSWGDRLRDLLDPRLR